MKYPILTLALTLSVIVSLPTVNASELTPKINAQQELILLKAYDIAKKDGHRDPELLQAVVFQETKAGIVTEGPGHCLGVSQLKLATAKHVLDVYPELRTEFLSTKSDKELYKKLKSDSVFNMSIASKYLLMLPKFGNDSNSFKAAAYNRGPGGAQHVNVNALDYVKRIRKFITHFKLNPIKTPEVVEDNPIILEDNSETL